MSKTIGQIFLVLIIFSIGKMIIESLPGWVGTVAVVVGLIVVAFLGLAIIVWPILWFKGKKRELVERAEENMRIERAVGRIEWSTDAGVRIGDYRGVTLRLVPDYVDLWVIEDPGAQALTHHAEELVWEASLVKSKVDDYLLGWVADVDELLGGRQALPHEAQDPWESVDVTSADAVDPWRR